MERYTAWKMMTKTEAHHAKEGPKKDHRRCTCLEKKIEDYLPR
jgi:hypothetical protein